MISWAFSNRGQAIFWPLIAGARLVVAEKGVHRDPAAPDLAAARSRKTT